MTTRLDRTDDQLSLTERFLQHGSILRGWSEETVRSSRRSFRECPTEITKANLNEVSSQLNHRGSHMKRVLPLVLLVVLFGLSTVQAAPITVMRFSGAITSVAPNLTEFLPVVDITVGTWFVGSLWIDDELLGRFVNFDITIGTHHITAHSANGWSNEDADYGSLYGNWPGLIGGYVDP